MVKCYDIVEMVINEATGRFAPLWEVDDKYNEILKSYCNVIDIIANKNSCESYEVEVDEERMTIKIILECPDFESEDTNLTELIKRTVEFGFSVSDANTLLIRFVFPSVWKHI